MRKTILKLLKIQIVRTHLRFGIDQRRRQLVDSKSNARLFVLTVLMFVLHTSIEASEPITMDLRVVDGNFHIEFFGSQDWDYDIERKDVEGRTLMDLRVPILAPQVYEQIKKIPPNNIVDSISLERVPGSNKDTLTLQLKSPQVESFDYLTEKPSRLVFDLYLVKKELAKSTSKKTDSFEKLSKAETARSKSERKPAMDEMSMRDPIPEKKLPELPQSSMTGIFDGGDPNFERFMIRDHEIKEEAIVRSQENLYIPFPMLVLEGQHFEEIKSQPPIYEINPSNNAENKMARLVLTLFEKKRLFVCLKTASWFLEKYPKSQYEEIIRFMLGDVYFKLWEKDGNRANYEASMQAFREALLKYPNSMLALRTQFLTGYSAYANKDYFGSLRTFQAVVKNSSPSLLRDKAQLAVAQALMRLNQFEDAIKVYEELERGAATESGRIAASYLKGDIYYMNRQNKKASEVYREAAMKYPQAMGLYPNAFYNLAESLFWQKLFKASLESYREFLTRFPRHAHAPFAMTRAGETLEILGADPRRVIGAFLETYFRYGSTEGSAVARMRLLSNRMKQMKSKESEKAIDEIQKISQSVEFPQIDLFASIMIAEGLSQRGEFERSIKTLLNWYQTNSTTRDAILIRKRVVRHVNEKMQDDVEKGNFFGALKLHNQYGELWLKGSGRIDTVYNLARSFELAGAYKQADILLRETANLLVAAQNSAQAREHSVFEQLPTLDQIYLRLAKIKMSLGEFSKAYDYLREIKDAGKLNESQQIERMEVAVNLLKEKGDHETAKIYLRDLIENWKGQSLKVVGVRQTLAELEMDSKDFVKAETLLKVNLDDLIDSKRVPSKEHFESLKLLSDLYLHSGKPKENKEILVQLLDSYESTESISAYRYRIGKLYFDEGNIQRASEYWNILNQKKETFWWGLAKNQLRDREWKDTYQKYIQRIPAMAKINEEEAK